MDIDLDNVSADTTTGSSEKRIRKSVSRLSEVYDKSFELGKERRMKPAVGSGTKLGDIARIQDASQRGKLGGDLVQNMHLLCYRTKGKAGKRLAAVKRFTGFDGAVDAAAELAKRVAIAEKMKADDLRLIGDLLNVRAVGSKHKSAVAAAIAEYLRAPFDTGANAFRSHALKRRPNNHAAKPKAATTEASSSESATVATGDKENEPAAVKTVDGARKRRSRAKKTAAAVECGGGDSDDKCDRQSAKDEPQAVSEAHITDEQITAHIESILRQVDIDTTTLSDVCARVATHFAQHSSVDLVHRRDHIRALVKLVIERS